MGKIYFVEAPGRIKVGYTRQPERRLASLQAVDMEKLTSLGVIDGTKNLEAFLHEKLSAYRLRGEWFVDCKEVREIVKRAFEGEFRVPAPAPEPRDAHKPSSDYEIGVIKSAIARSKEIADEAEVRIRRGESIADLAQEAKFLAEKVIGPGLYGHSS